MKGRKETASGHGPVRVKRPGHKQGWHANQGFGRTIRKGSKRPVVTKQKTVVQMDLPFPKDRQMDNIRYLLGRIIEVVQYIEYNLSVALAYDATIKGLEQEKAKKGFVDGKAKLAIATRANELRASASTMTFGALIATVSQANIMEKKDLDELEDILKTRNQLVHQFFKMNDFETKKDNAGFLEEQVNYLKKFLNRINNFNAFLFKKATDTLNRLAKTQ